MVRSAITVSRGWIARGKRSISNNPASACSRIFPGNRTGSAADKTPMRSTNRDASPCMISSQIAKLRQHAFRKIQGKIFRPHKIQISMRFSCARQVKTQPSLKPLRSFVRSYSRRRQKSYWRRSSSSDRLVRRAPFRAVPPRARPARRQTGMSPPAGNRQGRKACN